MRVGLKWVLMLLAVGAIATTDLGRAADSLVAEAARAGDLVAVRDLVANGEDVNLTQVDGSTALLWAAYHSDLNMTRSLIEAGAQVDAANRYGVTALLQSSRAGDVPVMEALLAAGADPLLTHPEGETPLMGASRAGRVDAVRLLLARGADVNMAEAYRGQAPLMWAAAEGHAEVVSALLEAGADPDLKSNVTVLTDRGHGDHPTGGFTALMWAVRNGHMDTVEALIDAGADVSIRNGDDLTAMMIAIINDRLDVAAGLLDMGADANDGSLFFTADMRDMTLDARARDGSRLRNNFDNEHTALTLMQLLLERGADPDKPYVGTVHSTSMGTGENYNGTALFRAAAAADVEALEVLLAAGSDLTWTPSAPPNGGGGRGRGSVGTPSLLAAINGGNGYAFGGGPGFQRLGLPPWRESGSREPVAAVRLMLEAGADPNAKTTAGQSALHRAADEKSLELVQLLVDAGADLMVRNSDDLTALEEVEASFEEEEDDNMGMNDPNRIVKETATPQQVASLLRELMGLGPDEAVPPAPGAEDEGADETTAEGVENEVVE
jgi:ankyrin repeat protein